MARTVDRLLQSSALRARRLFLSGFQVPSSDSEGLSSDEKEEQLNEMLEFSPDGEENSQKLPNLKPGPEPEGVLHHNNPQR